MVESEYTIEIPGEMRGKQRPRVTRRGTTYTPQETLNTEAWVKACAVEQGVLRPLDGPLQILLTISRGVPQSWSKKRRQAALANMERPTSKPDLDNCIKLVCDALNGIAWHDDAQIVRMEVAKIYSDRPATVLTVKQW